MNRRSFLTAGTTAVVASAAGVSTLRAESRRKNGTVSPAMKKVLNPVPLTIDGGLEPYVPSADNPWNERTASHLLRRTGFQATRPDIGYALTLSPQQAVDKLLEVQPGDYPAEYSADDSAKWGMKPEWAEEERKRYTTEAERLQYQILLNQRNAEFQRWWVERMYRSAFQRSGTHTVSPLMEKITFFWHNHFTSDNKKVVHPQLICIQNNAFRHEAFGSFKTLARTMVSDPAMLIYLDGATNTRQRPNENFARELLELFTLGEGHYTEHDVVEAARVVTGWFIADKYPFSTFDPLLRNHDFGDKTLLNTAIKPDPSKPKSEAGMAESDALIDAIFAWKFAETEADIQAGRPQADSDEYKGKSVTAVFLAQKLYRFFVYELVDHAIVAQLADLLVQHNFELKPVLRTLLTSAHFFDKQLHGALIKTPLDFIIGIMRLFAMDLPQNDNPNRPYLRSVVESMTGIGLEILNPPNVAGWPGYRDWINTATYPMRNALGDASIYGKDVSGRQLPTKIDVLRFGAGFSSLSDAEQFVDDAARYLLAIDIVDEQRADLLEELLQGAQLYEWTNFVETDPDKTVVRLQLFLSAVLHLPEFQLT